MPKNKLFSYLINALFAVAVFVFFKLLAGQGILGRYQQGLVILICINAILTVSLNLATGLLGELALGHAGFMAVGAYASALVTTNLTNGADPSPPLFIASLIAAGIVAAVVGFIVGIPALRLRGDYLAIITLAFGEIIRIIIRSLPFTGGALGLSGIPFATNFNYSYWILVVLIYVIYSLVRSRQGRAIISIREDDIASEASGINTTRYKALAFTLSAAFAGVAGGLYAHFQGVITPQQFDYNYSINIMVMVVLGGMGSITGSVLSAAVLTLMPELLRGMAEYRTLIYALLLILLMLFKPSGLLGQKELSQKFVRVLFRKDKELLPELASSGVGGSSADVQENVPVIGTPLRNSEEIVRKRKGEASSSDLTAPDKENKGKR